MAAAQPPNTAPTVVSLDRIERALATGPGITLSTADIDWTERTTPAPRRPGIELFDGFEVAGGVSGRWAPAGTPITAAVTHREMLNVMTPRSFVEGRPSDVLGVATAAAFALLPEVARLVGDLFDGAGDDAGGEEP